MDITGFGPAFDFMVMQSSYAADSVINEIDYLVSIDKVPESIDELYALAGVDKNDIDLVDNHRILTKLEEVGWC